MVRHEAFIGNIPPAAGEHEDELKAIFEKAGRVLSLRLVKDKESGRIKGFGFCEYGSAADVQLAIKLCNNHPYQGRQIRVDAAGGSSSGGADATGRGGGAPAPAGPTCTKPRLAAELDTFNPSRLWDIMNEFQIFMKRHPQHAQQVLAENPILGEALLAIRARIIAQPAQQPIPAPAPAPPLQQQQQQQRGYPQQPPPPPQQQRMQVPPQQQQQQQQQQQMRGYQQQQAPRPQQQGWAPQVQYAQQGAPHMQQQPPPQQGWAAPPQQHQQQQQGWAAPPGQAPPQPQYQQQPQQQQQQRYDPRMRR